MIPGLLVLPKSISYAAFCLVSCAYHTSKSLDKSSNVTFILQRCDYYSQIIACMANSCLTWQRLIISFLFICSMKLDITKENHRKCHLALNGMSIVVCNGFQAPSIYAWGLVFGCCIASNITGIHVFHSIMHLIGHVASSLQG